MEMGFHSLQIMNEYMRFMDVYVDGSSYEIMEFDPATGRENPKMVERLIAYNDAVGPWSLDKFSDRNVMRAEGLGMVLLK